MDNEWAYDVETSIYTMFKIYYENLFADDYSNLFITTDEEQSGTAVFPTVLIQQLGFAEVGRDLDGTGINGIRPTFQITISHNGTKAEIKKLTVYAAEFFKEKRFDVSNLIYTVSDKVRTGVFRASRVIGANNTL